MGEGWGCGSTSVLLALSVGAALALGCGGITASTAGAYDAGPAEAGPVDAGSVDSGPPMREAAGPPDAPVDRTAARDVAETGPRDAGHDAAFSEHIWAVGDDGTILNWNGSAWVSFASGTTSDLFGVWGSGSGDVWAVGNGGTILHWDGTAWSAVSSGATGDFASIWGSGATDVWAVGAKGLIQHWNGTAWSTGGTAPNNFASVWGSGPDDVWAVGLVDDAEFYVYTTPLAAHWNGSAWSLVALPSESYTSATVTALWGSGPDDVWAAGYGPDPGSFLHWDGSAWSEPSPPPGDGFIALWGSSSTHLWGAASGELELGDGGSWKIEVTGPTLLALWGSAADDIWGVGDDGAFLHRSGTKWSWGTAGTGVTLRGIWGG